MFVVDVAIVAGAIALTAPASFVVGRLANRPPAVDVRPPETVIDPDIHAAAHTWAVANGRPELAEILASKVQLAWDLQHGDKPKPEGR